MPYIRISTTADLTAEMEEILLEEIAQILPILPGKNRNNAMIHLEGGAFMAMGNPKDPCVFADVRLCGASPVEAKESFAAALTEILETKLGVSGDHIYLNYMEMDHWGMRGKIVYP